MPALMNEETEAKTSRMRITGTAGTRDLGLAESFLGHCHQHSVLSLGPDCEALKCWNYKRAPPHRAQGVFLKAFALEKSAQVDKNGSLAVQVAPDQGGVAFCSNSALIGSQGFIVSLGLAERPSSTH